MANVVIDIATEFTGKKAFAQAETSTEKLTRNVKKLAGAFGLAFGTAQVIAYGRASVKAALESQAEQERLTNILKVTTGATQSQIDSLNEQADALERIGVVTGGNIKITQSQLATFDLQISTIKTLTPAILDYVTAEKGAKIHFIFELCNSYNKYFHYVKSCLLFPSYNSVILCLLPSKLFNNPLASHFLMISSFGFVISVINEPPNPWLFQ